MTRGALTDARMRAFARDELARERFVRVAHEAHDVLDAFAPDLAAGTLKPAQHSSLLALRASLAPLNPAPDSLRQGNSPPPGGSPSTSRPAADLAPGCDRHGHAMGRPGA